MANPATREHDHDYIEAEMNYIVDDGVPPVFYIDWPEEAHKEHLPTYEKVAVKVENGRPIRDSFTLPSHGFAFVDHVTKMKSFYDEDEVKSVYYPETEALIKQQTGAARVHVFDHTIRTANQQILADKDVRQPVKGVHNDYTETSAPKRVRDLLPDEADELLKRRFAIVQFWRAINQPILSEPLGICDGRTIPEEGFIRIERRYSYRTAEVYHIAYNPAHRWFYFPQMTRNEALVFKVFDTDASAGVRFTAHTAFDDPTTPTDAPPRESIEMRSLVFY